MMKIPIRAIAFTLAALLSGSSATAFVLVTDDPNFIVNITEGERIGIACSPGGLVEVLIFAFPTEYSTACADVTSITVTATGTFDNIIDLFEVTTTSFVNPVVTINGGAGNDTLSGSPFGDTINGEAGADTISGRGSADTINGGDGNDILSGGTGNDNILGGNHDDTFTWNPGDGNDTFNGGSGTDTYQLNGSSAAESFAISADGTGFEVTRDLGTIVLDLQSTEAFSLNALGGNDTFTINDLAGVTNLIGITATMGDGDDNVSAVAQSNAGIALTINGDAGADTLTGSLQADTINGGAGNDTISGLSGIDQIDGGDGNDTIVGGAGNDNIQGGNQDDTLTWNPGDGSDTFAGGAGTDTLRFNGSSGAESFTINANGLGFQLLRNVGSIVMTTSTTEIVTLNALAGVDTVVVNDLTGVADLTTIEANMGDDGDFFQGGGQFNTAILLQINGEAGADSLDGSNGADTMNGGPDNDTIRGLGGIDQIDGGDGDDSLFGGSGNDNILGGLGNDTFTWNPGDGSDTFQGGPGNDVHVFNGSGANENFNIFDSAGGFTLTRDVGGIEMNIQSTEQLTLSALASNDQVTTEPLASTAQNLSGGTETLADILNIDAQGHCVNIPSGIFIAPGAQPIVFSDFEQVNPLNACVSVVRAWVAGAGVDTNPCTRSEPCRTFGAAVAATNPGGEVVVLDSAGYGPFVIDKAISIIAPAGVHAAIAPTSGDAVQVNTASHEIVILRGLYLNSQGAAGAVLFTSGAALHVEQCIIGGFSDYGILAAATGHLLLNDSVVRNNDDGVMVVSGASATISRTRIEGSTQNGVLFTAPSSVEFHQSLLARNFIGFLAFDGSVTFDRSAAIGNSIGFLADNDSRAMISRSLISHSSIGIIAQGTSQVHVAGTTIATNALGLNALSGGQILSRGDNRLAGNSTDGSFTGTFPPQ